VGHCTADYTIYTAETTIEQRPNFPSGYAPSTPFAQYSAQVRNLEMCSAYTRLFTDLGRGGVTGVVDVASPHMYIVFARLLVEHSHTPAKQC
jgi:hypothetical protein